MDSLFPDTTLLRSPDLADFVRGHDHLPGRHQFALGITAPPQAVIHCLLEHFQAELAVSRDVRHLQLVRGRNDSAPDPRIEGRHPVTFLAGHRSEEHTSELQSLMRISYPVFCL